MPLVSIITTTYKHEKYISETIESVLSQTFFDWELLIWDDSPNEETWNIIQRYTEKYPNKIRAWHHSPSLGIVGNTNFLLSKISPQSEYVAFLEGDDCFVSESISKRLQIFREVDSLALVYSDLSFINEKSTIFLASLFKSRQVRTYKNTLLSADTYVTSKNPLIVSYSSVMLRRSILEKYLPIENLTGSELYSVSDYDLFFRIATNHAVYGFDEPLTLYRRHRENLSSNYNSLFLDLQKLLDSYAKKSWISPQVYTKKSTWISLLLAVSALTKRDVALCRSYVRNAFALSPTAYLLHKIAIWGMTFLPQFLQEKILNTLIGRK